MRRRPGGRRLRGRRIAALARIDAIDLRRRPAVFLTLLVLLVTGRLLKGMVPVAAIPGAGPPASILEPFLWCLIGAGSLPLDSLGEMRGQRGWEPILASGLSDAEVLLGRILVPASVGLLSGLLAAAMDRIALPAPAAPTADRLASIGLALLPFALLAALLAVLGSIRFRTQMPLLIGFGAGGGLAAVATREAIRLAAGRGTAAALLPAVGLSCAAAVLFRIGRGMLRRDHAIRRG